jgi:ubiquinone biosynthesis protein
LSTRIDVLPQELIYEFKKLQTNIKPIKFKKIKNIIEKNINNKIENIFKKINENPLASASVAQVHTAISQNNEKLAIKIIKPGIKIQLKKDYIYTENNITHHTYII